MRRPAIFVALVTATAALATPAASPVSPASWADWVGDWDGKLTWASCSAEGERRATLPIEARDGVMSIDLSPAGSALSALTLIEDSGGWSAQQGDVRVRLRRGQSHKADVLDLTVELDSGCEVHGTLARPSVGIRACDGLAAWARVESQCTKLARPPLENAARLARQREQWLAARGEARTKLAAQCTARSAKVEAAMIDAGCAPHADPAIGLRGAECRALRSTSAKLARCGNIPQELRTALEREAVVLSAASTGADAAALPVVEAECRRARDRLVTIAKQASCPP